MQEAAINCQQQHSTEEVSPTDLVNLTVATGVGATANKPVRLLLAPVLAQLRIRPSADGVTTAGSQPAEGKHLRQEDHAQLTDALHIYSFKYITSFSHSFSKTVIAYHSVAAAAAAAAAAPPAAGMR